MSYKYVIDSSAWIDYLGGTKKGARIRNVIEEETATSIMAIAEIADKFTRENRPFKTTLKFIQSKTAILPLTISIALHAAKLKKDIRASKAKFGIADAIHLSTAQQQNATLLTTDTDFKGLKNVTLL